MRDWSSFSEEDVKSRLEIGFYEIYGRKPAEYLALIDALELRILPADPEWLDNEPIQFTWEMLSFTSSEIEI